MAPRYIDFEGTEFATIVLAFPAPSGGALFNIWSEDTDVVTVPATVLIPANDRYVQFDMTWAGVGVTQVKTQFVQLGAEPVLGTVYALDVECLEQGIEVTEVHGVEAEAEVEVDVYVVDVEVQSGLEVVAAIPEVMPIVAGTAVVEPVVVGVEVDPVTVLADATVCELED